MGAVSLDSPAAIDPMEFGVKTARLAAARQRGYPVLPGLALPGSDGAIAIEAGRRMVEAGHPAAARRAVTRAGPAQGIVADFDRIAALGTTLVVRSSTRLDDDGRWGGAFASYGEISPPEVHVAATGCWASVFAPDVLSRLVETDTSISDIGLSVLIQPQVAPALSGTADVVGNSVRVAIVVGSPVALLLGWESATVLTVRRGAICHPPPHAVQWKSLARLVHDLARRAADDFGTRRVEWAIVDGRPYVLQLTDGTPDPPPSGTPVRRAAGAHLVYRRIALGLLRRRGPLAEKFVVPFVGAIACGDPTLPGERMPSGSTLVDLLVVATQLAETLGLVMRSATGLEQRAMVDRLARGDLDLARAVAAAPVEERSWRKLLGALEELAAALVAKGQLEAPETIWWQSLDWLHQAVAGGARPPSRRPALDRFTPLLVTVSIATGRPRIAAPASPGLAAGRPVHIERPEQASLLRPGDVLVIDAALPTFAPLLWRASAVVAFRGSSAAHLMEVARALRRPAVVVLGRAWSSLEDTVMLGLNGTTGGLWLSERDRVLQGK